MANKIDAAKRAGGWQPRKSSDTNRPRKLSDAHIEALRDFGHVGVFPDTFPGLRIRIGIRKASWVFFQQHRMKGTRSHTFEVLGEWPVMTVAAARPHSGRLLVTFDGVQGRDSAEELRGTLLLAAEDALPPTDDPEDRKSVV